MGGIASATWSAPSAELIPAGALLLAAGLVVFACTQVSDERPGPESEGAPDGEKPAAPRRGAFQPICQLCRQLTAERRRGMLLLALLLAGVAVGHLRQRLAQYRPAGSVAAVLTEAPVLTRVRGVVLSAPLAQASVRRNPYLSSGPAVRTSFLLELEELAGSGCSRRIEGLVRVSLPGGGYELQAGERVELVGWLSRPAGPKNPGETDWSAWAAREGLAGVLRIESRAAVQRLATEVAAWQTAVTALRRAARLLLLENVEVVDGDLSSQILDAMVLGQRSGVSPALSEAFLRTASIHILSVSGFHVALLGGAAWWLLRQVAGLGQRRAACATALVLVLYAVLAEANAPILRATIMGLLGLTAIAIGRPLSVLNWLALAALFILLIDPRDLQRAGFQLSFLQVLAIVLFTSRLQNWLLGRRTDADAEPPPDAHTVSAWIVRMLTRGGAAALAVAIVTWLISLPLAMYHFGLIAPYGIVQTCLLTPLFSAAILAGFGTLLLAALLPPVGAWVVGGLHPALDVLAEAVNWVGALPGTLLPVAPPPAWLVLVTYALFGAGLFVPWWRGVIERERRRARTIAWAAVAVLLGPAWVSALDLPFGLAQREYRPDEGRLVVLSVGDGLATLAVSAEGTALAIDVGTAANVDAGQLLATAWREAGRPRLRGVVLTANDYRSYSGLGSFLAETGAPRVWAAPEFAEMLRAEPAWQKRLAGWRRRGGKIEALPPGVNDLGGFRIAIEPDFTDHGLSDAALESPLRLSVDLAGTALRFATGSRGARAREISWPVPGDAEPAGPTVLILARPGRITEEVRRAWSGSTVASAVVISSAAPRGRRSAAPPVPGYESIELIPDASATAAGGQSSAPSQVETWRSGAVVVRCRPGSAPRIETPFRSAAAAVDP